ncbi:hypothetical protein CMMCAS02_00995 [Clavibacter michiganensis subsp. michiganensis]|nr:hypothetical protein CMMCAS02_00995 [Clavibacter michiganensis subsp. michiganensis]
MRPVTAATARAAYAPAFTASVSGEASTLRLTVWRAAPAAPRARPTRIPAAMRGSRDATTTDASPGVARPVSACHTSRGPTAAVPCVTSITASTATTSARRATTATARTGIRPAPSARATAASDGTGPGIDAAAADA